MVMPNLKIFSVICVLHTAHFQKYFTYLLDFKRKILS